jgi:hypothetical protein
VEFLLTLVGVVGLLVVVNGCSTAGAPPRGVDVETSAVTSESAVSSVVAGNAPVSQESGSPYMASPDTASAQTTTQTATQESTSSLINEADKQLIDGFEFDDQLPDETLPPADSIPPTTLRTQPAPTTVPPEPPENYPLPEAVVGSQTWRQMVHENRSEGGPYLVLLERRSANGEWQAVSPTALPKTGGLQVSIPTLHDGVLYVFTSLDDATTARVEVMKSTDNGARWQMHGLVENAGPDGWPNGTNSSFMLCRDWLVNIDSEGSFISRDNGVSWNPNGGYFSWQQQHESISCSDPRARTASLPGAEGGAKS